MASDSTILGAAGEHYVMCQLLRGGMIAALAPTGVPNTDIVVTDQIGDRRCAIQVKTRREKGSDGGWHMKPKHEEFSSPNSFTALSISDRRWLIRRNVGSSRVQWWQKPC